jgi:hypothetical protein
LVFQTQWDDIASGFLTFIYQYRVTEIISGVKKGIKSIYEEKKQEFLSGIKSYNPVHVRRCCICNG